MEKHFAVNVNGRWATFPFSLGGRQIIAQISTWTNETRIWLNDDIVARRRGWFFDFLEDQKVGRDHTLQLSDSEQIDIRIGYHLEGGMFCKATVNGVVVFEDRITEEDEGPVSKGLLFLAGIGGAAIGYLSVQVASLVS